MKTSLSDSAVRSALGTLVEAAASFARRYPGETGRRQPVHVVYGGAHLFHASLAKRLGELALKTLGEYGPDAFTFARAAGLPGNELLPKSGKQESALEKRFARFPEKLRQKIEPLGWPSPYTAASLKNFSASRSRIFALILKMATGIAPMRKRTTMRSLPRKNSRAGLARDRFRPSSAFASSRFRRSYAAARSARSIFSSARCAKRLAGGCLKISSSRCPRS